MIGFVGLTQGVGIASALIIIRIGLGVDSLDSHPQATAQDTEGQVDTGYQMAELDPQESLGDSEDNGAIMNKAMAQPFMLKYEQSQ